MKKPWGVLATTVFARILWRIGKVLVARWQEVGPIGLGCSQMCLQVPFRKRLARALIPRSSNRGLIEAICFSAVSIRCTAPFRDHRIAASLKL